MDIRSLLSPANEPAVPVGSGDESSSNPAVALRKAAKPTHSSTSFVHAHRNTQSREHHFIEQHSDHSANVARQSRPTQMTAGSRSHRNQQQQQSLRVADSNEQISHHPDLNRQIPVHLTAESSKCTHIAWHTVFVDDVDQCVSRLSQQSTIQSEWLQL